MMNKKELEVLSCLRKNAKMSLAQVSKQTKIPSNSVSGIIKSLEKNYIKKYTILMNFSKIGYNLLVVYFIKKIKPELLKFLISYKTLNSLYTLENNTVIAEILFKNLKERQKFVEELGNFDADTKEYFIIEELKRESFTPHCPIDL